MTVPYFFAGQSHQSYFIPWPTGCEWHCFTSLPGCFINHVSSHDLQPVSDTALFLCQAVSSIMFHNSMWVTLLYFFARQSHQSYFIPWPTECEWHCFISLTGSLINHVSSHDQQYVSVTALFLCQTVSSIMFHPMTNREWVTLLYFFPRQLHQSCFIPWPTGSEWHCFISLPGCLINHVSSHDQQGVSNNAWFLYQAVSSIMFHPMTNSMWVTLLYFFARQSHQSCFIPWPTGSEWHCFISLQGSPINHVPLYDPQIVSDTTLLLFQAVPLIILHPMTNREWVTQVYFFTWQPQ